MKTKAKNSIQWILMTGAILISALSFNSNLYGNSPIKHKLAKSNSEKITKQIDKINNYLELLKNTDEKKSESIHRKIGYSQEIIRDNEDELFSEANANKLHTIDLPFTKYNFDIAENSLVVNEFSVSRDGGLNEFHLGFKTDETGTAKIDIISPGGELLQSNIKLDYNGSFGEEIKLNVEKGKTYFVLINVDGKQTTKKLRFE